MTVCTKVNSVSLDEGVCRVITDGIEIRVSFLLDGVVRIRAGFDKDFREESYALATTAWADRMDSVIGDKRKRVELDPCSIVEDNDKKCVIDSGTLSVEVEKDPFRICIYSGKGDSRHLVHADVVDIGYQEDSNHRRIHSAEIEPTDCFFGFGEKSGEWNKAQTIMTMSPKDSMGYDAKHTDSLYKHIPFYIRLNKATHEAVGYYYNNTAECDFDMGRDKSNYWHMHSRYRVDSGDIDLFVIPGGSTGSISSIVDSYTKLTGRSCMLPEYALGYLGSSMYYAELDKDCDDAIVSFIDTAKKEGIPIDGFQLSSGYCTVQVGKLNKRCVFTWNKTRFKDPKDFFKQMSDRGIEVSPNVKPGLLLVHPMLEEFKRDNMLVLDSKEDKPAIGTWWGGKGMFVDFTRASTREHWKKLLKQHVIDYGTSSIWNDNCEYDSLVDKDGRCYYEDGSGCTIGKIKAVMSNLMCQLAVEAIERLIPILDPSWYAVRGTRVYRGMRRLGQGITLPVGIPLSIISLLYWVWGYRE